MKHRITFLLVTATLLAVLIFCLGAAKAQGNKLAPQCGATLTVAPHFVGLPLQPGTLTIAPFNISASTASPVILSRLTVTLRTSGHVAFDRAELMDSFTNIAITPGNISTSGNTKLDFKFRTPLVIAAGSTRALSVRVRFTEVGLGAIVVPSIDSATMLTLTTPQRRAVNLCGSFPFFMPAVSTNGHAPISFISGNLQQAIDAQQDAARLNWVVLVVQKAKNETILQPAGTSFMLIGSPALAQPAIIHNDGGNAITMQQYTRLSLHELSISSNQIGSEYYDATIFGEFGTSLNISGCEVRTRSIGVSGNYCYAVTIHHSEILGPTSAEELESRVISGLRLSYQSEATSPDLGARILNNRFENLTIGTDGSMSYFPIIYNLPGVPGDSNSYHNVKKKRLAWGESLP